VLVLLVLPPLLLLLLLLLLLPLAPDGTGCCVWCVHHIDRRGGGRLYGTHNSR
jgi:hypothetical protein